MTFTVLMGVPAMQALWKRLEQGARDGTLKGDDRVLAKKRAKAVRLLSSNPKHPSLQSHKIEPLTKRFGGKVFQSYLENNTPAAGRMFWVYAPGDGQITVVGLEPHPEDAKHGAYDRVLLSKLPEPTTPEPRPARSADAALPTRAGRPKRKRR